MKLVTNSKLIVVIVLKLTIVFLSIFNVSCALFRPKTVELLLDTKLEKYHAYHEVSLVNTDIGKELIVNGNMTAASSRLNKVFINGNAKIENSVVSDDLSINGKLVLNQAVISKSIIGYGELVANNSQITTINMAAKKIVLNDTIVSSIRIRQFKNTIITIGNGSIVTGDIIFDEGIGKVFVDKQSKVKGSITSGKEQHKKLEITVGQKKKA